VTRRERVLNAQLPLEHATVLQVFRVQGLAARDQGGRDDHRVIDRQLMMYI
jgi:hypothetical protein